ncbi:MAG TPA: bifunctional YncE family protein/alkaline phosphatase family protein [Chthoniobacterales bacterium]
MKTCFRLPHSAFAAVLISSLASFLDASAQDDDGAVAQASKTPVELAPTGQRLTPLAAPGSHAESFNPELHDFPNFRPSGAAATVISPDRKTLVAVMAGYNQNNDAKGNVVPGASNEYVFFYDISTGTPHQTQVIQIPNAFVGVAFNPSGKALYVGGGQDDDVHTYALQSNGRWAETGTPIALHHEGTNSVTPSSVPPSTAGLAVSADGSKLVVANLFNDSLSIVDLRARKVTGEVDLRPGKVNPAQTGVPGGEYPYGVAIKGNGTAYVASLRDREVVVVDVGAQPKVLTRIKVQGTPNEALLSADQARLYVTADIQDVVNVIDTASARLVETIPTAGPNYITFPVRAYKGSSPNNLALSPDGSTLYVTNAGTNSLAVIRLNPFGGSENVGLIPTTFWPSAASVSNDGKTLYIANWKSPTGPNPHETNNAANQYVFQLQKASLLTLPVPDYQTLDQLTRTVAANNGFLAKPNPADVKLAAGLHRRIKHVIYIVKENRTYDQILGDLEVGNGDPALTQFGKAVTPNFHRLAREFVDLDNFYDPGDVSGNGWIWSTAGRETDFSVKSIALNYSGRGFSYDSEGTNRDVNVGDAPSTQERLNVAPYQTKDPDVLPGRADVNAPDAPEDEGNGIGQGYLWDAAVRKGVSIRNYGFFEDLARYGAAVGPYQIPLERDPALIGLRVAFPTKATLLAHFDPYFRGFDNAFPDYWREREWEREFKSFETNGNLPQLSFVRLMHDHMGNFGTAIDGVNTPETQQADNDYAVALLIDRVNHSRYKDDTLILAIEDDSQDGADHVDAHRSTAYVVGPYVKRHAVVSTRYSTVNLIRTIEDVLGLEHLNLYTATARPMSDCFDLNQKTWSFTAEPSAFLVSDTELPLLRPDQASRAARRSTHESAYWAQKTAGFDFSREDHLKDPAKFNRMVWEGLKGNLPYPAARSGADLRQNRRKLLEQAGVMADQENPRPPATASTR